MHIQRKIDGLQWLWSRTLGDPRVCIAVVDGPVDLAHPCLSSASITPLCTIVDNFADSGVAATHGTFIASILFGMHNGPVSGIAPNCRGLILPVFRSGTNGNVMPCSQLDLGRAILQAASAGANVINISGGQLSTSGEPHPLLGDAVKFCADNGILLVAAAGNDGCECLHIPAAIPSVLVVGAMDDRRLPMDFSNWAGAYSNNGLLAPGTGIVGGIPGGDVVSLDGTSAASAVVSGVAALLMSLQLLHGHSADPILIRRLLLESVDKCAADGTDLECRRFLAGKLNLVRATTELLKILARPPISPGEALAVFDSATTKVPTAISFTKREHAVPPHVDAQHVGSDTHSSLGTTMNSNTIDPMLNTNDLARITEAGVVPSAGCACAAANKASIAPIYALGKINFDFGSPARRDSIMERLNADISLLDALLAHLERCPWDAAAIIWTLEIEGVPVYSLKPSGPFAANSYERIRQFAREQATEGVDIVAIPGVIDGKVQTSTGQVLPTVCPEIRGMASWNKKALLDALGAKDGVDRALGSFLDRIYFSYRNQGITPQERAINYAATNAFNLNRAFEIAHKDRLQLDEFQTIRSPLCRPESECWDVKLSFFYPNDQLNPDMRRVFRFTVDVSDVVPVMIGGMKIWDEPKRK